MVNTQCCQNQPGNRRTYAKHLRREYNIINIYYKYIINLIKLLRKHKQKFTAISVNSIV